MTETCTNLHKQNKKKNNAFGIRRYSCIISHEILIEIVRFVCVRVCACACLHDVVVSKDRSAHI